jgi:serine/threonine protein kinase
VILYAMVTGRLPFDDDNIQRLLMKVQAGQFHMPHELPESLQNLIHGMLTVDPSTRITIDEIKAHPWFNTFPPRYYPIDTFEVPVNPVLSPDPRVLTSLADLGWGDVVAIAEKLSLRGSSMEKVFYDQLSRHRMFSKPPAIASLPPIENSTDVCSNVPPASSSIQAESGPNLTGGLEGPVNEAKNEAGTLESQISNLSVADPKDAMHRVPASVSWPGVGQSSDRSDSRPAEEANSSGTASAGTQPHALVRQSQLIRSSTEHAEITEDDNIETAIETGGGAQKSWFESVRDMWSWQGKEPDDLGGEREHIGDTGDAVRADSTSTDPGRSDGV